MVCTWSPGRNCFTWLLPQYWMRFPIRPSRWRLHFWADTGQIDTDRTGLDFNWSGWVFHVLGGSVMEIDSFLAIYLGCLWRFFAVWYFDHDIVIYYRSHHPFLGQKFIVSSGALVEDQRPRGFPITLKIKSWKTSSIFPPMRYQIPKLFMVVLRTYFASVLEFLTAT